MVCYLLGENSKFFNTEEEIQPLLESILTYITQFTNSVIEISSFIFKVKIILTVIAVSKSLRPYWIEKNSKQCF